MDKTLKIIPILFIVFGCSSGSSPQPNIVDDETGNGEEQIVLSVFPEEPLPPFAASDIPQVIEKAIAFENSLGVLVETYFEQVNTVVSDLTFGIVSHPDSDVSLVDNTFYDRVLSQCNFDYASDGVEIVGIICNGMPFLDFQFRHAIYDDVFIQLRSGSIFNDGTTSLRYVLVVRQFGGLEETQIKVEIYTSGQMNIDYGLVGSLDCNGINTTASSVADTNINRCASSIDAANFVLMRLNSDVEIPVGMAVAH